jgi:phage host-nuclease inhibitor protein Gam
MSTATDLVAAAAEAQEPVDGEALAPTGWKPKPSDLMDVLGWAGDAQAAIDSIDAQVAVVTARIKEQADKLKAPHVRRREYALALAAECATANKDSLLTGKRRSVEFLTGKISWRRKGGRLDIVNAEELEAWLTTQDPKYFRVRVLPEKKELTALVEATGVIPPGCEWVEPKDDLSIDVSPAPSLTAPNLKELP